MFTAQLRPGDGFINLQVAIRNVVVSNTGRPVPDKYKLTKAKFKGIVVNASQREVEQFKQNGHPITHKIIQYGGKPKAKPTDIIVDKTGRQLYVQGAKNPAGLDLTMIYYVEESLDLKWEIEE